MQEDERSYIGCPSLRHGGNKPGTRWSRRPTRGVRGGGGSVRPSAISAAGRAVRPAAELPGLLPRSWPSPSSPSSRSISSTASRSASAPGHIAATALWMDGPHHEQPTESGVRPDLRADPHRRSRHTSATRTRWRSTGSTCCRSMSARTSSGNPPFGGGEFHWLKQRAQVHRVAALGGSGGTLDYVTAWFIRAGASVRHTQPDGGTPPGIGFVETNSRTRGLARRPARCELATEVRYGRTGTRARSGPREIARLRPRKSRTPPLRARGRSTGD